MPIHFLNTFTCNAHFPKKWKTGLLSLLIESDQGLILVDTGIGTGDYANPTPFTRIFRVITEMPFDEDQAAIRQIERLGYKAEDLKHIALTHMHFDHLSGLADFPHAEIHLARREYDAFMGKRKSFFDLAYDKKYIAHNPNFKLYDDLGEKWFDFDAIRLPFTPEMWLIPLEGHTRGHCGVALKTEKGWRLHCGDAAGDFRKDIPAWAIRLVLGPHEPRLRAFGEAHPEVELTASHMFLDFFND
jgi:glyoxylase-like metal-dependent hydrolase (beta-lactamase superfamily II)